MPRGRRWTDEQLTEAVQSSTNMAEVMRKLGLVPGRYDAIRAHIRRLGLEAPGLISDGHGGRRRGGWTEDDLAAAVAKSSTYAEVMRRMGYVPTGGVHRWLKSHIVSLGISTDHFTTGTSEGGGRGVSRGQPLVEVLVKGSTYSTGNLRRRLIREGVLKPECSDCGLRTWRGQPVALMLDHINGDPTDHRLENLRILCPNCHSQTPTWCNRSRGVGEGVHQVGVEPT